ncbi:MAG: dTDP-4-dehydrorhamnose reductase [Planctomycetes bacterium]|nr:dTDP-4-dehydrorhamnose reductase [Planctomycetota bacterium]
MAAVRYLVTGANGQLGRAMVDVARSRGDGVVGLGHAELAVEDADATRRAIAKHSPEVVVHCGAWTDVDGCERDPERANRVNGHGTANVAEACRAIGAKLVYVSTDFVFDGTAHTPYRVDAEPAPVSAYGRSKLLGEQAVLRDSEPGFVVVRTSWVFGPGGKNFPRAILSRARSGEPLRVVDDQVGSPTFTLDLAVALVDLAARPDVGGIFHASNDGSCSWHEFARCLVDAAGLEVEVGRMSSSELDRPAPRPSYSVLDCSRLTELRGRSLPDYHDAIRRYLELESP